ncbi:myb-like protein F [Folsomia candida]|nr:myb-like protein F [Folsomia candida]
MKAIFTFKLVFLSYLNLTVHAWRPHDDETFPREPSSSEWRHKSGSSASNSVTPLFGFGVGYKKITHYVPVLTFQTRKGGNRRPNGNADVVVHTHVAGDGNRPSVTISGGDNDDNDKANTNGNNDDQTNSGEISAQNSQNLQTSTSSGSGISVQSFNLRSDDNRDPRRILHRDKKTYGDDDSSCEGGRSCKNWRESGIKSRRAGQRRRAGRITDRRESDMWGGKGQNDDAWGGKGQSETRRSGNHGNERISYQDNDSPEISNEMNEYTIGGWDWTQKSGYFGFKKLFGNVPRSSW